MECQNSQNKKNTYSIKSLNKFGNTQIYNLFNIQLNN